jgi:hypothetical protein
MPKKEKIAGLTRDQIKKLGAAEEKEKKALKFSELYLNSTPYRGWDRREVGAEAIGNAEEATENYKTIAEELKQAGNYALSRRFYDKAIHAIGGAVKVNGEFHHEIDKLKDEKAALNTYRKGRIEGYLHKKGKQNKNLESAAVTSIIGIIGGIFFLSPNLTGNVIGNMTNSTSNIIGAVLLVIGLIGSFFWFRSRRR